VLLLKRNRAVAAIVPVHDGPADKQDLWGAMRGTVTVAPGVDLTDPAGEVWDAEQ
jgi:antitoxin (DNA-binding transcriptional repressor) of toxin-antitoxin stability system